MFVGNRPGTQVLDVSAGVALALERAQDMPTEEVFVAQADLHQCYDHLPVLRLARWMSARGLPDWFAAGSAFIAAMSPRHRASPGASQASP